MTICCVALFCQFTHTHTHTHTSRMGRCEREIFRYHTWFFFFLFFLFSDVHAHDWDLLRLVVCTYVCTSQAGFRRHIIGGSYLIVKDGETMALSFVV
jgi:hypothetical protein